ncbi:PepSY-associated TM helix domain-containing protein [Methylobacterium sp. B4]|uniref:PepSY-associated TM helix domain-containing protein n=1 Tax=Methylobacterium sp. B4 TaxID=1938755 RepID=UPI000D75945A|nr:PepSY-associated TM helix domain-containing protein [Methylobacterium sp. B4]PXW51426.1 putative iron-regulated membrane protein [Methylobacterium sp. B4]
MKASFRQSMAWLHAWSGLMVGWVLFAVFVTGTASYYRSEISRWMRPELVAMADPNSERLSRAAEHGVRYLKAHAGDATGWSIGMPSADFPLIELYWRSRPGPPTGHALLDPQTGEPAKVRATKGGDFFYRFHFELHMPPLWGRWVVGICAMIMLIALVSGIITHRRIFADFFTFRRNAKSVQRGWLDAHNVSGVLALPFHLMITYTGLITFALLYMPWGVQIAYHGDAPRFYAEAGQILPLRTPLGQPGALLPLGSFVTRAIDAVPQPLERITVNHPYDVNATVLAIFEEPHGLAHVHPQISFDGVTGAELGRTEEPRAAARTFATMVGLHEAHFAGPALRLLFFLSGLMGCAMVATGLLLWTAARLPKAGRSRPGFGWRLVHVLNVTTIAGLPIAIAVYLLANRLLSIGLADRAELEVLAFFTAWVATAFVAALRPRSRAWSELLTTASILFAAVAAADGLRILLADRAEPRIEPFFFLFDGAMLCISVGLVLAARKVMHRAYDCRTQRAQSDLVNLPIPSSTQVR